MTIAFPRPEAADFQPQSAQELRDLRAQFIEHLHPRTVDDLKFLRSIDEINAEDEQVLESILALDYVIGDE